MGRILRKAKAQQRIVSSSINAVIVVLLAVLLSGCNHWKWVMKNHDKVCATCPKENATYNHETDTTIYSIIPADTLLLEGLDFPSDNNILVDNSNYKIIKEKGRVVVVTKEREVPYVVTKHRIGSKVVNTIRIKEPYVPFVYYLWLIPAIIFGWFLKWIVGLIKKFV
jgi:hypothetical protein